MENKQKHLEFIQAVINRMAGNSFLLKAWTVTLTAYIRHLTLKDTEDMDYPTHYASDRTVKAYKKALKEKRQGYRSEGCRQVF